MSAIEVLSFDKELLVIERLAAALEKAARVDEIKDVRDRAMAVQLYARKKAGGLAAAQAAGRVVTQATMRLAELYKSETSAQANGRPGSLIGQEDLPVGKVAIARAAGMTAPSLSALRPLIDAPKPLVAEASAAIEARGEVVTPAALLREVVHGAPRGSAKFSSESDEWYTPAKYIEAARIALGGFDLDPASSPKANEIVRAKKIFTRADDGINRPWKGRVWLNPPYALINGRRSSAGAWGAKLVVEYTEKRVDAAILLVNAVTDAGWFQPFWDYPICFTDHRIEFYTPNGLPRSPVSGNAFVYLGHAPKRFADAFAEFGPTMVRL
jgi:phage N-6-adenine-methyltransferase